MRTVRLLTLGLGFCHVNCERFPQFIIHLLTVFFSPFKGFLNFSCRGVF